MDQRILPSILNTTRLRILREVAACGTLTAAAKALYMTQPAVSQQIAALEREVGVPLVERTTRSMRLTEAGLTLVRHADVILADCEEALADIRSSSEKIAGVVRMSIFRTAAGSIALTAMVDLRKDYPDLEVVTRELPADAAVLALKAGQLDIALSYEWDVAPIPLDPGLDRFPLFREPLVVLLPARHPLGSDPVRLRDLADERWCVSQDSSYGREVVGRIAESIGLEMHVVFESDNFRAIGSAVEAGLGVGLAPLMTDLRGLGIVVQPLVEPSLYRTVYAVTRRCSGHTPTIKAVLDALAVPALSLHHPEPEADIPTR
jgi:molybdate transport repressor ModE-like protein